MNKSTSLVQIQAQGSETHEGSNKQEKHWLIPATKLQLTSHGQEELHGKEFLMNHIWQELKVKLLIAQLFPTFCDPTDYSVHEILQARILEWVSISFSRGSSWPRDWTQVSQIAGRFFTIWDTREDI